MSYQPDDALLDKYANVLVNFALRGGEGVRPGEVVQLRAPECAKPMLRSLQRTVLRAGAHPLVFFAPDGMARERYELSSDEQLSFFPEAFYRGLVDQIDHTVAILAEADKHELDEVESRKIVARHKALKPYLEWRREKESQGRYSWTLALYGTQAMADEVGLSLEAYWKEIVRACYLDEDDPAGKWRELYERLYAIRDKLDALPIERLHVEAEDTDLWVSIGKNRKWLGGSGRNIPSFELFTSPDWRGVEGRIRFTEPLYIYGKLVEGVYLEFEGGRVAKAAATKGEDLLKEMIAVENADKVGEFSLTDRRFSRITKFMGETLYDENVGGERGNTHLALGAAYRDAYPGDPSQPSEDNWAAMGYNNSVVHTDIVATSNRTVTAVLDDGSERVIYRDGEFQV